MMIRNWLRVLSTVACCVTWMSVCADARAQGDKKIEPRVTFATQTELIRSLAFTSDGKQLVVSPQENDCLVYDATSGEKSATELKSVRGPTVFLMPGKTPGTIYCIEKLVNRLVDLKTGKDLAQHGVAVNFSPCGGWNRKYDRLFFGTEHGGIGFLASNLAESVGGFSPTEAPNLAAQIRACAVAYSADGKLAASARPNGRVYLWTANNLEETGAVGVSAHRDIVDALEFTPTGLLSLGLDGYIKRWNTTGDEIGTYSLDKNLDRGWLLAGGQIAAVVKKPLTGQLEFYQVPAKDGELKLVASLPVGDLLANFPTHVPDFTVPAIAISPDGQRLAVTVKMVARDLTINRGGIYDVSSFMPKMPAVEPPPREVASGKPMTTKQPPVTPAKVEREFRNWKTADGASTVEAQFLGKIGDNVRLKRKDNEKVITIPLAKLSAEDQTYVRGLR
ncbi:SHD1 domain-containing protein [Anatilimnocola floriformis]|uniref:SHD1 domain-containing protein n=1 Tax=Anatilimnocola floriformis TaxID=2948575 RepID=UPI0020C2B614|nr:SHD1 domain-containing protein [Anatilimnocola floriformis]